MKRSYTTYTPNCKKLMDAHPGLDLDLLLTVVADRVMADMNQSNISMAMTVSLERDLLRGEPALHIYMPDAEACDWMISSVEAFKPEYVSLAVREVLNGHALGLLHFPTASKRCSVLFELRGEKPGRPPGILMTASRDNTEQAMCISIGCQGTKEGMDMQMAYYVRLVFALGHYISAFPQAVVPGLPEDLKHPAMHQHNGEVTIKMASEVIESVGHHASPRPHYRVGHLRFLRSEFYTHKRFQCVWVEGGEVKGDAETLLSLEDLDELEKGTV